MSKKKKKKYKKIKSLIKALTKFMIASAAVIASIAELIKALK